MEQHFHELGKGQSPHTLVVTCSDSRLDPALLLQADPGDIFVVRNAGNLVPSYTSASGGEIASIEFGIQALGVRNILICGHSHCGAMNGALAPESLGSFPAVAQWLDKNREAKTILESNYDGLSNEKALDLMVQINLLVQVENLKTHPVIKERIQKKDLNIFAWVYQFEKGKVFGYNPSLGYFTEIQDDLYPVTSTDSKAGLKPIF